jgi:hypothetical protein
MMTDVLAEPAEFALVPFRDTEILAARVGDTVRVPMKRFCGSIGLEWEPQRKRIGRDEVLNEGTAMMEVPSDGGSQRQVTLRADLIPGFLFGADAARYAPELRERVRTYRRECFAVLYAHFFAQAAMAVPVTIEPPASAVPLAPPIDWRERAAARRDLPGLVDVITAETRPTVRRLYYQLLAFDADRLGLPLPGLDQLGADAPEIDPLDQLIDALTTLTARRVRWNHLRIPNGRKALNIVEVAGHFVRHDIDMPIARIRSALSCSSKTWRVTVETITGGAITRKPVHCHVLERWS